MEISRREFIHRMMTLGFSTAAATALFPLAACSKETAPLPISPNAPPSTTAPSPTPTLTTPAVTDGLAVVRGKSPSAITEAAVKALGGIERFVKPGNTVIIKPNICVAYHTYEYAATTNPEVISTLVRLCRGAGAQKVSVMDQPFGGTAEQAYLRSGIQEAVRAAGGEMVIMSRAGFKETNIPEGKDIKKWMVYNDALEADVLINVPIAKHHSLARLTLSMKNLMGLVLDRPQFHFNLPQRVADLASLLRPELTVIDAVRILTRNGPTGGSLDDVKMMNTVIAGTDFVAMDAYAATLFGLTGADIPVVRAAAGMGLGMMDLSKVKITEISV
ncbi:MAG: DUF362 domain-containing protein [Dehalococcoidales bacterium]|nr:DUF362 domain-containing protein [Dehalococcoidales bacterium]